MATSSSATKSTVTTAPMLRKPPRRGKVPCGVCQGPVVDGKDEALLCEGKCGLWFHRGCASVPPCLYKELSNSEESFFCLTCANLRLKQEVILLKNELKEMAEIRDRCSALATEVLSLRQALESLKETVKLSSSKPSEQQPRRTYARAVRIRQPPISKPATSDGKPALNKSSNRDRISRDVKPGEVRQERVTVPGVRRVWGTFKSTPTGAVAAALKKLTTLGEQLRVKRKFREGTRNDRWWFLLYGEEELLKELDGQWEKVALQTNWKIESCTKPAVSTDNANRTDCVSDLPDPNGIVPPQSPSPAGPGSPGTAAARSSNPSTPANVTNGENSFLDGHQDPQTLKT